MYGLHRRVETKLAQIIQVLKSGNSMDITNCKPISVLPFFSKVYEKLAYNHIIRFLTKHNILVKYQFDFHKEHPLIMQ